VIAATQQLETYLESFTTFAKHATGHNLPWLRKLREDAFARFCETGFPTTRDEDWRFTNVSPIVQTPFHLAQAATLPKTELEKWRIEGIAHQFVFVNGRFAGALSSGKLPAGVEVASLAAKIASDPAALEQHLGRYLNIQRDAFCALNTAFAEDGAYIRIRKGAVLEEPIYLLFLSTDDQKAMMNHPRNLIVAEENSQLAVIEDYVSTGAAAGALFSNTVTELVAADHAVVTHCMVEREHVKAFNISTLRIQQGRSANVSSHSLLLGGGLVRNNVHPVLAGEGADCLINGLYLGTGQQHLDNYMMVEHASPHCGSRQFYNGILDDHSHGVFHGRIVVHKDAQKTDAKQTNRNLLLCDDAQIDTKPQLEIYADDVKCTHGATIGQIEESALFYLRSRGIDEVTARKLLLAAFASECLDRMEPQSLRSYAEALLNQALLQLAHPHPASSGKKSDEGSRGRNWKEIG